MVLPPSRRCCNASQNTLLQSDLVALQGGHWTGVRVGWKAGRASFSCIVVEYVVIFISAIVLVVVVLIVKFLLLFLLLLWRI